MNESLPIGQPLRIDAEAASASLALPAFIARPRSAPVYHGFPLLKGSKREGFVFGAITEPNGAEVAEWGDAFVAAPNGSRAGIVWQIGRGEPSVVCEPSEGRWSVYGFHFEGPVATEADRVERLHTILPALKAYYGAAETLCPESTRAVST